jgi:magnesium-protoporphyrin IX monomethyl ester (oxidative) cyclase
MKVTLVSMPWATVNTPSLALGILARRLRDTVPEAVVDLRYANLDCAEWLVESVPDASRRDYDFFALESYFQGCGDWVFSSALYDDPRWRVDEFIDRLGEKLSDRERDICLRLHDRAPAFIEQVAGELADSRPDLVCFTSTFQQSVASLAAARRIRQLSPGTRCVFGGANCDGDQGRGLHQAFGFVDFVVRGEGERAFPELVRSLIDGTDPAGIPGLCWRDGERAGANPMTDRLLAPAEIPMPDYDAYFARVGRTTVGSWFEPRLVVEAARGCWWGEKHHCTFCGLNGSAMTFRSKRPEVFRDELEQLARRHRVLDFYAVDNILDMAYLETVLRDLADGPCDYRIQYEIKSNLRFHQLQRLRDAGVTSVQPGIENLSSVVLRIMDKGVSGTQNVRLLRDAETLGLTVMWNYLYGFPGEQPEHYTSVLAQLPALHHLDPPGGATRIALERFSPYFNRPELGFGSRRPHWQYAMIYDLPEPRLREIAYLFETPPRGIDRSLARQFEEALSGWYRDRHDSTLSYRDLGDVIELTNTRPGFGWRQLELPDPAALSLFRALESPRTRASLASSLAATGAVPGDRCERVVRDLLAEWTALGLLFTDDGRFVQVATGADNQWLCRVRRRPAEPGSDAPPGGWWGRLRLRRSAGPTAAVTP